MTAYMSRALQMYDGYMAQGDPRVENWLLMKNPISILTIFFIYLVIVYTGPRIMKSYKAFELKWLLIPYNFALVGLSFYMFYEFLVTAVLSGYNMSCQLVDYSDDPMAMRMASVCWWFFFSKVIELLDTVFIIIRKKDEQISFLHVYHHTTMIICWWMAAKYVPGGQSFFNGMVNSLVHVIMYSYYALSALGPAVRKYLWWKRYLTWLQLIQFVSIIIHTSHNIFSDCPFPNFFNWQVFIFCISLVILFSNFYYRSYVKSHRKLQ